MKTLFTAAAPFEAARYLEGLPAGHRQRALHGHGFVASLRCVPPADGSGPGSLRQSMQDALRELDYSLLNERVPQPTDENLARWLQARLPGPPATQLGIRSRQHAGVDLDASGRALMWRRYRFEAAHRLPRVPEGHKCGRMHGHGFEVVLHALHHDGSRMDHDALDALWAPLHAELDHSCLNELPGLTNPTSEVLASWIWTRLKPGTPGLAWVTVFETGSSAASFDGARYAIWKEMTLDSAVRLRRAPEGSAGNLLHGHTYRLRLHLSAPLHEVLGWTVDYGDVKTLFKPIFDQLDHQPLYEIPDLADCDVATLAAWVLDKARARLPQVDRVDLYETPGCGAIVSTGDDALAFPL